MLRLDTFFVDGRPFDWCPENFALVTQDWGVRTSTHPTLSGARVVIVQAPRESASRPFAETRRLHSQAWNATWDVMDSCLYDYLFGLWTTQRAFTLQFDDEMARSSCALTPHFDRRLWYTPTYPIVPFGFVPGSALTHTGNLWLEEAGVLRPVATGFAVDESVGLVRFAHPLARTLNVVFRYTWRARVRIAQFDVAPRAGDHMQGYYTGSVVFEQVPSNAPDFLYATAPCTGLGNLERGIISGTTVSTFQQSFYETRLSYGTGITWELSAPYSGGFSGGFMSVGFSSDVPPPSGPSLAPMTDVPVGP